MPSSIPNVRGAAQALYPLRLTISTATSVARKENGREQRWMERAPLVRLDLTYNRIGRTDVNALAAAHRSSKGMLTTSNSIILGAETYTNLAFEDDAFSAVESRPTNYASKLRLRQVIAQGLTATSDLSAYPSITAQLPYTRRVVNRTYVSDMATGRRWAYGLYGTGLAGFPGRPLGAWEIQYSVLQASELTALMQFFTGVNGRTQQFSYTDAEDGTVLLNCRFGMDDLVLDMTGINQTRVTVVIEEFNA